MTVGCAGLPERPVAAESHAYTDVADTRLARILGTATPPPERGMSGFRLLPEGASAFNARVALARRADKSIDAQYYLIEDDDVGRQFLRELRDAAVRGVRVRLLVDDLYAAHEDPLFAGLAAYPNVEVRIFNPLPERAGGFATRLMLSLHDFQRINHRMHNKLFIADNALAVSGGRNIGSDYFMLSAAANFIDLDVLSSGPVVREFSKVFDSYWNSDRVYPIGALLGSADARREPEAARARFDELVGSAAPQVRENDPDRLGSTPVARQLDGGTLSQVFAPAHVFADSPDKGAEARDGEVDKTVTGQALALFAAARESVEIVSPYFIPGPRGLAMMQNAIASGEHLSLVTNSIGATDALLVHGRYVRYRLDMLKAGVEIHEVSPTLSSGSGRLGDFGRSIGRLHAKVAVIDRRLLFVGSMNFDARSARINTESGLVIDSPELMQGAFDALRQDLLDLGAYDLRLAPDREHIEWIETRPDGTTIEYEHEPASSWLLQLKLWFLAHLVGEDLL